MSKIIYEPSENTHWKNLFASKNKLLGSHNMNPGEEIHATIKSISSETVYDKNIQEEKSLPVLVFKGDKVPPMALNITNAETIAMLHGVECEGWVGKSILIHKVKGKFFGKEAEALRIRPVVSRDINTTDEAASLQACTTLEELQKVFVAFPPHVQGSLVKIKDEMKGNLSNA